MSEILTEHCGVIASVGPDLDWECFAAGWWGIRNRGMDSFGLVTVSNSGTQLDRAQKSSEVPLPVQSLQNVDVDAFLRLGQNRYATSGGGSLENAQPFLLTKDELTLGLAHNGNIPTEVVDRLRLMLLQPLPGDASDSRVMTQLLMQNRQCHTSWEHTFMATLPHFQGAFSLACMTEENVIYAIRDPWGIHPLCLGKKGQTWVVASESVALDEMGVEYIREVEPGEIVRLADDGTMKSTRYAEMSGGANFCALEIVYFAKINSILEKKRIKELRQALGRAVAMRFLAKNIDIDLVIPILNSGKQMSVGVSDVLQMANIEAITLASAERSFIQNTPENRAQVVNAKHVIDGEVINGKKLLLCDDSVVRGTSVGVLVRKIRQHNPAEIHLVLGSEPVIDICNLGIDLPSPEELLVYRLIHERPDWEDIDEYFIWLAKIEGLVAEELGVDSVTYLDRGAVNGALEREEADLCRHCFGGKHPIKDHPQPRYIAPYEVVQV